MYDIKNLDIRCEEERVQEGIENKNMEGRNEGSLRDIQKVRMEGTEITEGKLRE